MKYAIILLTMFLTNVYAKADTCSTETTANQVEEQTEIKTDVPKHLVGATVCVRLADGKESCVPAEKFKVVPRKQQFIVTKVSNSTVKTCSVEDSKRHRVSVMGGKGPTGHLDRDNSQAPNKVSVESEYDVIGGAQYQYRTGVKVLSLPVSVGGQLQTNKSGMVLIGVDF